MKKIYLLPALLGGFFASELDSQAQQQNIRELFLKEFDKNKDGKLDESERPSREQMQEFFQRQQGNTPARPGAGGNQPGQGRPDGGEGGRGGFRPPNPIMEAIDKNKDGTITADELKNASKALAALDKNKDGKIDQEEMRPQFDRGQGGGREGFRRPGQGGQSRPEAPRGREGQPSRPGRSES